MGSGMSAATAPCQPSPTPVDQGPWTAIQRSVNLAGPAGRLEALLNEGSPDAPFAAIVCHPHPLGGGTLHNKVVYRAMKVLNAPEWGFGWPVLRFNFRGTGLSEGRHDGEAESADVLAAMRWIENEYKRPLVMVGFSFGAVMSLRACCSGDAPSGRVRALISLGLPIQAEGRDYKYPFLSNCSIPKFFLSGDADQFAPAVDLVQTAAAAGAPTRLQLIPGADHFFTGHLGRMQEALQCWLKEQSE